MVRTFRRLAGVTWVRRTAVAATLLAVVFVGLAAAGASGGLIVRGDDGCPRSVGALGSVSWVDVLHIEGATYERVNPASPYEAAADRPVAGDRVGVIRCAIADSVQRSSYHLRNGEATFLQPGTPVHVLTGTDPGFRVVAIVDGSPVVYENR